MIVLPPKRYESTEDAKYDPIRHHIWFAILAERRQKLAYLGSALASYSEGLTQLEVRDRWGIDPKELREYENFKKGRSPKSMNSPPFAAEVRRRLALAYQAYNRIDAAQSYASLIQSIEMVGATIKPRIVSELWEKDPNLYPAGYQLK